MDWLIFGALFWAVLYGGRCLTKREDERMWAELDRRYRAEHGGRPLFGGGPEPATTCGRPIPDTDGCTRRPDHDGPCAPDAPAATDDGEDR